MKRIRGRGRTVIALALVLAVLGMLAAKCPGDKVAVRAVARGVMTPAPFFVRLGTDIAIGAAMDYIAGEVGGGDPGLYGGTRDAGYCDKAKLVEFLEKPENRDKAKEWAEVEGLDDVGEIRGFVKKLTPVLLRADTLVKNHDFDKKKGKRKAFDALLEAGIAVLVDQLGRPAVQCSCGNPLASFKDDVDDAKVEFDARNKKWPSYDSEKVAKVKAAPEDDPVEVFQLVDVEDPDAGLAREAGTDGTEDEVLPVAPDIGGPSVAPSDSPTSTPTAEVATVPDVQDLPLGDAQVALEDRGFQVTWTEEVTDAATPGTVVGQSPEPGTEAPADSLVTLTVASAGTGTGEPTPGDSGGEGTGGTAESGGAGADAGADAGASDSGGLFGGTADGG
ncbi:PASTA domain-containing protein [Streptomyces sp. S.PB5]|uniref:PASTA domain-containing protein n=1 Tax=Streptomyces sp. S.PB5 TaxID=3020844 RepID=UPI0025AF396F|nr:PASTA domain-containing protein [Streptomyces sp. S.PB5]MDN3028853.1 PASTA domain-containing protein [Streptomyces sp. S.PB5]